MKSSNRRPHYLPLGLILLLSISTLSAHAFVDDQPTEPDKQAITSIDLLIPVNDKRDINTINLSYSRFMLRAEDLPVAIYGGITATYSRGDSTQVKDFEDRSFADIEAADSAFGLGPQILTRTRLKSHKALTIYLDATANVIIYNKRFPNNGEQYNFLFRAGPVLEYRISDGRFFGIGFNWTHISNGQGEVPENPSYDAMGVTLNLINFF